jgi:hypothetical protein
MLRRMPQKRIRDMARQSKSLQDVIDESRRLQKKITKHLLELRRADLPEEIRKKPR